MANIKFSSKILSDHNSPLIGLDDEDGSNTGFLNLCAGRGASSSLSGFIQIFGNEYTTSPNFRGRVEIIGGDHAEGAISLQTYHTSANIQFRPGDPGLGPAYTGGIAFRGSDSAMVFSSVTQLMVHDDSDEQTVICGGGTSSLADGGILTVNGKDLSGGGVSLIGSSSNGNCIIGSNGTGNTQFLRNGDNAWLINGSTGALTQGVNGGAIILGTSPQTAQISIKSFGYSSSYKALFIGDADTTYTDTVSLWFNVDASANSSGSFAGTGVECYFRENVLFRTPNAANNNYHTFLTMADGVTTIGPSSSNALIFRTNNTSRWSVDASSGELVAETANIGIRNNTADASDNRVLYLAGGGALSVTRGALIQCYGNEASNGSLNLYTGDAASTVLRLRINNNSSGTIRIERSDGLGWIFDGNSAALYPTGAYSLGNSSNRAGTFFGGLIDVNRAAASAEATSGIFFKVDATVQGYIGVLNDDSTLSVSSNSGNISFVSNTLERWSISSSGQLIQNGSNGSDLIMNLTDSIIRTGTSDGSDTKRILLCGGGAGTADRGGVVHVYGNEHSTQAGNTYVDSGSTGNVYIRSNNTNPTVNLTGDVTLVHSSLDNILIRTTTSDGSDTDGILICGGGTSAASRGAILQAYGNEATGGVAGNAYIDSGATGNVYLRSFHSTTPTINFTGDLLPSANNTYDVGSSGLRVKTFYAVNALDTSDQRLKTDIVSLDPETALIKICALNPVNYKFVAAYDSSDANRAGFLAQEVVTHIPEAVSAGDSDLEKEYGDEGFETWSMQQAHIIPYLAAAIKQLNADKLALEARIEALEALLVP